ncbi:pantoate--beta-alanine ligase [Arthrobacter sp. Leaf234]|uniref:pantoate--beta-alanine ligase n=1 Tax=Arthrobacter sp. Leaf234 TaxID=1736303 RepID=UPI0006FD8A1A|nr:pantoate--beta-alanine ligase [Arthrobacter sp. Leaf234]KQO03073.1 pantoate--beta-alanine ligase [Arthrobacter sp. Leaf234]
MTVDSSAGSDTAPLLVSTPADLQAATAGLLEQVRAQRPAGTRPSLGLVPTMGGLHAGHASLARAAREANDVVVASVFVNPLQFGDPADLERYPRTLDDDLRLLGGVGVDIVFAPSVADMYPGGEPLVRLSAGRMGEVLEGASRPGHFDGMLTVVSKLLNLGLPGTAAEYRAYFGEKDAQQLAIIRRMVLDLNIPVAIEGVAIVRDDDGLALSSRNRFLDAEERRAALVLSRVLHGLAEDVRSGRAPDLDAARAAVSAEPWVDLDYLEAIDPASFAPVAEGAPTTAPVLVVVAARVGAVRLIDNMLLPAVG